MMADREMLEVSGFELIPIPRHIWAKQIAVHHITPSERQKCPDRLRLI